MNEAIIRVENLSKRYRIGQAEERFKNIREVVLNGIKAPLRNLRRLRALTSFRDEGDSPDPADVIWALRDVSFDVNRGDVLGVIGRNGAGKTTLFKILSRITEPTTGDIRIYGRVSSLLEVGTGFHQELTGRENIYLNGAILGMRKAEIDRKFDEIVAFAEVDRFIDTPVKRYSSGMYVRLAFAVAAHLEPEILLVDEVLAVGDIRFQKKCLGKMEAVAKEGRTVLFVSHNMATITSLCKRCILLDFGRIIKEGDTSDVVLHYARGEKSSLLSVDFSINQRSIGDHDAVLLGGSVLDRGGRSVSEIDIDEDVIITMRVRIISERARQYVPYFHFNVANGICAFLAVPSRFETLGKGEYALNCVVPGHFLNEGIYNVGLALSHFENGLKIHFHEVDCLSFNVRDPMGGEGSFRELMGYGGPVPGVVRPVFEWRCEKLSGHR